MEAFSFRSPSYVVRTPHSYCFRMVVPKDLRETVGLRELKYSLRTGAIGEAKYRARRMAAFVQALFRRLRRTQRGMTQPGKAEIKGMLEDYLRKMLEEAEENRAIGEHPLQVGHGEDEDPITAQVDMLMSLESDFREDLARLKYQRAKPAVENFLSEREVEADPSSDMYRWICREMMKVMIRYLHTERGRTLGDYSEELQTDPPRLLPGEDPQQEEVYPLRTVIDHYLGELESGKSVSEKTLNEYRASLNLFSEVAGDIPIGAIDAKIMRNYKETLLKLPAGMKKSPIYRDKSIPEILAMDDVKPMSITTANKNLVRASTFLKYAVTNGYIERNYAEGIQVPTNKRDSDHRNIFTSNDLEMLFRSSDYLEDNQKHPYRFWVPIIGLFSGCRLEEICQLRLYDIKRSNGIWFIDINNDGDKRLKTPSALRPVPIHSFLIDDLNFLGYVQNTRNRGERILFPELTRQRDGYGQRVSRWFGQYKRRCGIESDNKKKDFHSFRHTFIDNLKQSSKVEPYQISELVGHASGNMTMSRYGKPYMIETLKKAIEKLDFGIDLTHLKYSKFVLERNQTHMED